MNEYITDIEPVTSSDILALATWNRQRPTDELLSFISKHHDNVSDVELCL